MTPSRTAACPGASIAPSAELVSAIQGTDQAADPPQTRWAACISPPGRNKPQFPTWMQPPESASAGNHSPKTATGPRQPIPCSAPASTWDAQEHAGSWWWFRNEGGGDFATRMGGMSGQPRRNAPLNGLRPAAQSGSAARDLPGVQRRGGESHLASSRRESCRGRHVRPSACRYGYGPALVVHSEDLSFITKAERRCADVSARRPPKGPWSGPRGSNSARCIARRPDHDHAGAGRAGGSRHASSGG